MNAALVPVKTLEAGKSRLAGALDRGGIEALTLAMLADLLEALAATPEIDRIAVVTPDAAVAEVARAGGAEPLLRRDPGLNPSLDAGARALAAGARGASGGLESLLVVLGDVAGALPEELSALFSARAELGMPAAVLAPARDGGTAALLRSPPDCLPNRFGPGSAAAHREAAAERGVAWAELALPSLAIDLDRPEDLDALAARDVGAPRTRALVARLRGGAS